MILSFNVYVDISILNVVFECCTLAAILIMCSMYVCMFLTRCHEFPFPATRGHLPRGATFAPNRRWPLVAGTTVPSNRHTSPSTALVWLKEQNSFLLYGHVLQKDQSEEERCIHLL